MKIPLKWTPISVRLGEWSIKSENDCDPNEVDYCAPPVINNPISEVIAHKKYRKNSKDQQHDIALIRLSKKVQNNDFVLPVCLPLDPEHWNNNKGVTHEVTGWGN